MKGLSTALRGFTQESARHAIQSNTVQYLAEIRFVTTIFINIYGLEEQLKRGGGFLLQQTMDLGVGSLLKFGGVLRQFVVDDKGCVMIGAFGLPQYRCASRVVALVHTTMHGKHLIRAPRRVKATLRPSDYKTLHPLDSWTYCRAVMFPTWPTIRPTV